MAVATDGRVVYELIVQRLFEVSDHYVADAAQQVHICRFSWIHCICSISSGFSADAACMSMPCSHLLSQSCTVMQNGPLKPGQQFKQLQAGIVMLAKHAPQFAVDSLEQWRKRKVAELHDRGLVLSSSKKSLAAVSFYVLCLMRKVSCPCLFRIEAPADSIEVMQMEGIVFITMMMLMEVTVQIHPDSATVIRERALDIILRADSFVSDLTDHREFLTQTCKDAIGSISRYTLVL